MLRFELDTDDLERLAAAQGYDLDVDVDAGGRLVATVRGLKFPGLSRLAARVRLGPIGVSEPNGIVAVPVEVLSIGGIKLGRKLVAKKVLNLLRRRKWPGVNADAEHSQVTVDARLVLDRALPSPLAGYRVVPARFTSRKSGAALTLAFAT